MNECTCGKKFRDAEDFRDHLPCEGTKSEQKVRQLNKEITRLKNGIELIMQEAISHEDSVIKEMTKNILAGKDPYHYNGD